MYSTASSGIVKRKKKETRFFEEVARPVRREPRLAQNDGNVLFRKRVEADVKLQDGASFGGPAGLVFEPVTRKVREDAAAGEDPGEVLV